MSSLRKNLKKIFQEEAFALFLLAVLGPFSLFLTLSMASLYSSFSIELPLFVLLSFFVLFLQPEKGWKYALGALFFLALFRHFWVKNLAIWEFGLEGSLSLGLLVTQLSLEQVKGFVKNFKGEVVLQKTLLEAQHQVAESEKKTWEQQKRIYGQKEAFLQEEILKLEQENKSYEELKAVLTRNLEEVCKDNQALVLEKTKAEAQTQRNAFLVKEIQEELSSLKNKDLLYQEKQNLLTRLNQVRVENYQLHLQIDALHFQNRKKDSQEVERLKLQLEQTSLALQEAKKEKGEDCLSLEIDFQEMKQKVQEQEEKTQELLEMLQNSREELTELRKVRSSYHQLKNQFEEKKNVLHLARKELFHLYTEKAALEKKQLEKEYEQEHLLQEQFREYSFLEVLVEQLEQENHMLTSWLEKSFKEESSLKLGGPTQ